MGQLPVTGQTIQGVTSFPYIIYEPVRGKQLQVGNDQERELFNTLS